MRNNPQNVGRVPSSSIGNVNGTGSRRLKSVDAPRQWSMRANVNKKAGPGNKHLSGSSSPKNKTNLR